ncbi:Sorting nexin-33 [Varanus komodoensis]|uniref:Sorting nexin n=1 Tax=Varanus komodoensis TaxID=61221 RepID=A0A8D2LRX7_VARKO|nr:sorting nexin-33 [Varanus komodoensis]XP_044294881.1 sorting nexin-33 [Varanus komodoensis]XP_044294882.1 sorting nexin-33 [Varanus komodoensis]KAF7241581.1 Sorting nexin-33 [Varanus komodoensis]
MSTKARALYNFQSENKEEISIRENEELVIFSENSLDGWLQGTNSRGETGLFPASYVEILRSRSASTYTDYSQSPAGNGSSFYITPASTTVSHQGSFEDDDDDDWDDWDDSCTVVEEQPRGRAGTNGHPSPSLSHPGPYTHPNNVGYRPKPSLERQDSIGSSKRGSVVGRNLNRFSCFVRSGVEAFILGDVPMMGKIAEAYYIDMGPKGPQWRSNPHPLACSVEDPTKQTKFKGIKSYISYRLTASNCTSPVYRRYKHFDWLYNRLLHKFTVISVPHLPEKQATGRFEDDFIEKRKRRLILWMDHMTTHPALSQYEGFQHFLTCGDDKQWKMGKRRAEKDEMVGASFLLTLQIPTEHQDLQDVEDRVDTFKAFSKKMEDSVLQLTNVASELVRKHAGGFRKEFQKLGSAFQAISQSFQMDPPYSFDALNGAISHTGKTYETVGEMFAEQPKNDLFLMLDTLSLYQGLLSNFPDIIHLQKGAFAKVKESQRMSDEGKMDQDEADGIRKRCRVVGFALQAEMNHFHERRILDFKKMMQSYLKQQIVFYQRVSQQLEKTLRMYDNL